MTCKAAFAGLSAVLILAGSVHAQTSASQAAANPCAVAVQSRTAGVIEIIASAPGQSGGPQLMWRPVASGPSISLWLTYPASAVTRMDEPSGVMIRFRTHANLNPDTLSVLVQARNGRSWGFDGKVIKSDSDVQAHLAFDLDWPYGRGVISAVADAQPLTISVQQDGVVLETESFGLSNIDARDSLLAEARTKFQALNPASCPAQPAP